MNEPEPKSSLRDLMWKLPAIGFMAWVILAHARAVEVLPWWAKIPLFISCTIWSGVTTGLIKSQLTLKAHSEDTPNDGGGGNTTGGTA